MKIFVNYSFIGTTTNYTRDTEAIDDGKVDDCKMAVKRNLLYFGVKLILIRLVEKKTFKTINIQFFISLFLF